jgi:hypothetical protein
VHCINYYVCDRCIKSEIIGIHVHFLINDHAVVEYFMRV